MDRLEERLKAKRPSLIPLKQWFCDSCGEIIAEPKHGYIEWQGARNTEGHTLMKGFRIVHHALYSPSRRGKQDCYYPDSLRGGDLSLDRVLEAEGRAYLVSWLSEGGNYDDEPGKCIVAELPEWTEIFRRLHVPFYEEARQYLPRAFYGDFGEYFNNFYSPEVLKSIIEHYREEEFANGNL